MECLGLHNKPKAEVHLGYKLTGPKEEEGEGGGGGGGGGGGAEEEEEEEEEEEDDSFSFIITSQMFCTLAEWIHVPFMLANCLDLTQRQSPQIVNLCCRWPH
jgi:hypothetical protein